MDLLGLIPLNGPIRPGCIRGCVHSGAVADFRFCGHSPIIAARRRHEPHDRRRSHAKEQQCGRYERHRRLLQFRPEPHRQCDARIVKPRLDGADRLRQKLRDLSDRHIHEIVEQKHLAHVFRHSFQNLPHDAAVHIHNDALRADRLHERIHFRSPADRHGTLSNLATRRIAVQVQHDYARPVVERVPLLIVPNLFDDPFQCAQNEVFGRRFIMAQCKSNRIQAFPVFSHKPHRTLFSIFQELLRNTIRLLHRS